MAHIFGFVCRSYHDLASWRNGSHSLCFLALLASILSFQVFSQSSMHTCPSFLQYEPVQQVVKCVSGLQLKHISLNMAHLATWVGVHPCAVSGRGRSHPDYTELGKHIGRHITQHWGWDVLYIKTQTCTHYQKHIMKSARRWSKLKKYGI